MSPDELDRCGPAYCVVRSQFAPGWRFECRPISAEPPEKTVAIMYRRNDKVLRQCGVGVFQDGRWTNDKGKPLEGDLFWTHMVKER